MSLRSVHFVTGPFAAPSPPLLLSNALTMLFCPSTEKVEMNKLLKPMRNFPFDSNEPAVSCLSAWKIEWRRQHRTQKRNNISFSLKSHWAIQSEKKKTPNNSETNFPQERFQREAKPSAQKSGKELEMFTSARAYTCYRRYKLHTFPTVTPDGRIDSGTEEQQYSRSQRIFDAQDMNTKTITRSQERFFLSIGSGIFGTTFRIIYFDVMRDFC